MTAVKQDDAVPSIEILWERDGAPIDQGQRKRWKGGADAEFFSHDLSSSAAPIMGQGNATVCAAFGAVCLRYDGGKEWESNPPETSNASHRI